MDDAKDFGLDWIKHEVKQQSVRQASKDLVVDTFVRDDRTKQAGIDICKYFVS